jgi:hypothetical protein
MLNMKDGVGMLPVADYTHCPESPTAQSPLRDSKAGYLRHELV